MYTKSEKHDNGNFPWTYNNWFVHNLIKTYPSINTPLEELIMSSVQIITQVIETQGF